MDEWADTPQWEYIDNSTVNGSDNRIALPEGVFDRGILTHPAEADPNKEIGEAHWSFDSGTGWVILSDRELDDTITTQEGKLVEGEAKTVRYKSPGDHSYNKVYGEENGFRVTIPKAFFDDAAVDLTQVEKAVRFNYDEVRHFVTAAEFYSDEPTPVKSCYVLTTAQLNTILQHDYDHDGPHGDTPQFI
jgi:hypothetical protein